ncbi:ABC transporter substrate-binding protein [Halorussus gelatinilyticus]|uniref:ABC transporter substrate-binding protein n=1 Tax=Halorussus gelatinilyticus TaxID=2937524 RepID=A0A8U0IH85_9EURY|nr:ABC transporter substrate-binding protein [Halorussus gelatinilyticus]UPW00450.1 ABC transporter substrate-binding protein [Halorussus gelatinilyticus]
MTGMEESRRAYLKTTAAVAGAGLTGLSGCIGSISGGGGGGGPIQMGSILPITGSLSPYGQGMQDAVNLAKKHINDAGGPLGRTVKVTNKDSETKPSKASQKYKSLVNEQGIVGFVGAASSGVSVPLAKNVASDGVMQVSHASTTPALAEIGYNDDESIKYFGRTAPNDGQQGLVMGRTMNEDKYIGADKAAFLYVNNAYGKGLAKKAKAAFDGETVGMVPYDKKSTDYTSTLDKLFENDPDAIGFVGYPGNGKTILKQWNNGGYGGEWVLSEGLNDKGFFQNLKSITDGMYLASPSPESAKKSTKAFNEGMGDKSGTLFAAHAYDGLFLQALAMHKAGKASGKAIAKNIRSVSREGTKVYAGQFKRAKDLLDDSEDINYQGASSPVDMNANLEPLNKFAIMQVQKGKRKQITEIERSWFEGKL